MQSFETYASPPALLCGIVVELPRQAKGNKWGVLERTLAGGGRGERDSASQARCRSVSISLLPQERVKGSEGSGAS